MTVTYIAFWLMMIPSALCLITDKEYAQLPPVFDLDNFDRCMLLQDEAVYCTVEFFLRPADPNNHSPTWKKIKELNADPKNYRHDKIRHGICVPFTCPNISVSSTDLKFKDELANCYNKKYEKDGLVGNIGYMHCQTSTPNPMDSYDLIVAISSIVYLLFIVYASFYEGLARYKPKEEYEKITGTQIGKIICSFSIVKNWIRLKTVNWTKENEAFKAFQGVRFCNVVLVVLCHTTLLYTIGPVMNTKTVEGLFDNTGTIFVASGPYVVGTFFLLTSCLLTYHIFVNFDENSGKPFDLKTIFLIIVYRLIRLSPPLIITIIFHSTLLYHVSSGPWWDLLVGTERTNCRKNGWMNILYINNMVNDPSEMCFLETWFTAVDMQAFILVLVILYFTVKAPKRLLWIIPSVWVVIQAIFLKRVYDLEIFTFFLPYPESLYLLNGFLYGDIWINTIAATSSNLAGSIVGIILGYCFYKYKNANFFTKKNRAVLWWFLSFGMGLAVFVLPGLWIFSKKYYPSMWFSLPYFALGTTIFVIAVAIGLFGCSEGNGHMAKWFVEWPPMHVLGRLVYTPYLVHYAFMLVKGGSSRYMTHMSNLSVIISTIENLPIIILLGLIMTLTVELPLSALQSAFLKEKMLKKDMLINRGSSCVEKREKNGKL